MFFVHQRWRDEILQWEPADYGDVDRLTLAGSQVWIPEIAMINSVDEGSDLTLDTHFRCVIDMHRLIRLPCSILK